MPYRNDGTLSGLAIKIGIAGAVGFGAIATGMIASRKGRNLMREAWQGRQRTTLEDRVLEVVWSDRALSRRRIDVAEQSTGVLTLLGEVRTEEERRLCAALAEGTRGVTAVDNRLEVVSAAEARRRDGTLADRLRERALQVRGSGAR
jgi:osmotically-inducible protein OsmY